MTGAYWDAEAGQWVVDTDRGRITADVLVPAVGNLAEPALPDIHGIDTFAGEIFHSARWDHTADLAGKRVAVIGTGASAIQIIPEIAKAAGHLDVYQRTAPWVMPRRDRDYSKAERWAFGHLPGFQRLSRELIYWGRESFVLGFAHHPKILAAAQRAARKHLETQVADPELRRKVTPRFQMGCKRILLSNDYYPALMRETTELVTDRIAEIRPDGIVTADGRHRPVDVIVVATGFHVTDSPSFDLIKGADGRTLGETWRTESMQAYKGSTIAGFPNMVMLVGPNTGLGHSSMVFMIESQLNYLLSALDTKRRFGLATFEVRRDYQEQYNRDLQARLEKTIWKTGGCASWYLDQHGRNTTLWPKFTFQFRQETRTFDLDAYTTTALGELAEQR
jgi:cyclohexanone monooxygenase